MLRPPLQWAMRAFMLGFAGGLLLFGALNLLAAHLRSDCGLPAILGFSACADDIRRAGFPFLFWEAGGFLYRFMFSWPALWADVGIALGASTLLGILTRRFIR